MNQLLLNAFCSIISGLGPQYKEACGPFFTAASIQTGAKEVFGQIDKKAERIMKNNINDAIMAPAVFVVGPIVKKEVRASFRINQGATLTLKASVDTATAIINIYF